MVGYRYDKPQGVSMNGKGLVSGTSSALAVHVATVILENGGNAMDATVGAVMAQIVIAGGSYVSFGGLAAMVYYDAKSGKIHSLNGVFNKPLKYDSDNRCVNSKLDNCLGYRVLVPGFFRAMESAHKKFGKLKWETVLEPAIYFSEKGFIADSQIEYLLKYDGYKIFKFEEGKRIFINPNTNQPYKKGELFRQLELADTLKNVSQFGSDYMYTGEWAKDFVTKVNQYGGIITMQDMIQYQPIWGEALNGTFKLEELTIHGLDYPSIGGMSIIEAMNLIELLNNTQPYNESANSLYQLVQIARWGRLVQVVDYFKPQLLASMFPNIDLSFQGRLSKTTARQAYDLIFNSNKEDLLNRWLKFYKKCETMPNNPCMYKTPSESIIKGHSDSLTVADSDGNVVALVHSINSQPFGTGLIVGGIPLSDAISSNLGQLASVKGGQQILNPLQPIIVTLRGKPLLAQGTIGGGLHEYSILNLYNVLVMKKTPKQAVMLPHFQDLQFRSDFCFPLNQTIYVGPEKGGFSLPLVQETQLEYGQCFNILGNDQAATSTGDPGYIAQLLKPTTSQLILGAVDNMLNGWSEGL
ncbi:Gamma-glutamyltranspeptidase [Naegleria gruberi]|uniref:Gamma-glutamyltranspeptidase n=1 Tax=Naegleria gruberi TaxID=5762 RepID=D2VP62_NAEGR|nr:Gamma-glutamyltranspeptidase [Naegleria gruberi]EFC41376.1 Gamma-glutamyltranspeptidase [Naegleria gruberi]|eukprot:XP_002674120.1 Gamma-glutamyltranspeptidase [Naegleria gruberi strain NEG-M]